MTHEGKSKSMAGDEQRQRKLNSGYSTKLTNINQLNTQLKCIGHINRCKIS